jgi:hypothetical protein
MRLSSREGRSIVETVHWLALGKLLRRLEGINLSPEVHHIVLGGGDVHRL